MLRRLLTTMLLLGLASVTSARPLELPAHSPHGILIDRVVPMAHIEDLDGVSKVTGDLARWRQAVHELSRSAEGDLGWPTGRALQEQALGSSSAHEVPLALMHARYDRMDSAGVVISREAFSMVPLRDRVYQGSRVTFSLGQDRILTRPGPSITQLTFDADDGQGPRPLSIGGDVSVSYATEGPKRLVVTARLADGRTLESAASLEVVRLATPAPHDTLAITATEPFAGAYASGQAYIYLAPGHSTLTTPAVVVEGFDLDNTMDWPVLYDALNGENLLEDLRADGFDAVVLDFTEATEPIQRNAFVLTELLNQVEARIAPGTTVPLVGASMGGLVSRYALLWLEQNGGHNVRTFISFDSPQNGANIPLGLQHWLDFFQGESADAAFLLSRLNTPAARQMLLYHYLSTAGTTAGADPAFAAFQADLAALGSWPSEPRLVGVANGSGTGLNQGFNAGDQVIFYEYRSLLADIDGNVWAVPDGGTQVIFDGMINLIWPLPDSYETVTIGGTLPWDSAPGGSRGSMAQMGDTEAPYGDIVALHDAHCFIPTVSALALDGVLPFHDIAGDADLMTRTGFDQVYFPVENQAHIAITPENKVWLIDEIEGGLSPVPDLTVVAGPVLYPAAPNPFNPRTTIRFELATPGTTELKVYDLAGRLVRTLVDGQALAAGTHRRVWDGKDHAGRSTAAGVYVAQLEVGDVTRSTRLTLVK